jgi:hypothetical protein
MKNGSERIMEIVLLTPCPIRVQTESGFEFASFTPIPESLVQYAG